MPESFPLAFVEIRVLAHATEDQDKVLKAFKEVISETALEELKIIREKLVGHYKNPIELMHVKVHSKSLANEIVVNIFSKLARHEYTSLLEMVENRLDNRGALFLRLDKQAAYCGKLQFSDSDPVRVQIKLLIPHKQRDRIIETFKEIINVK
mgnify:CR=1 FL=1